MKTSEPKTTATSIQRKTENSQEPFFQKEGAGSFFSGLKDSPSPFFTPQNNTIQAKLTIGQPNDKYEQEADAVADQVVQRLVEPGASEKISHAGEVATTPVIQLSSISQLQRKCEACEQEDKEIQEKPEEGQIQLKPIFESNGEEDIVQKKCAACNQQDEHIMPKSVGSPTSTSDNLQSTLSSTKGGGSPLGKDTQSNMESAFGTDFSQVRIHTNSTAIQMNKELNAQAFTHGSDIYFNSGKYNPNSSSGQHLLAHELTHTVQQGERNKMLQKYRGGGARAGASARKATWPKKSHQSDGAGKFVLHYQETPYSKTITKSYRPSIKRKFELDALGGKDMDSYTGVLKESEYYVLKLKARIIAIWNISKGYIVTDSEEKLINDLIEYIFPHEKAALRRSFNSNNRALYYEVYNELDDHEQKKRFNRLMNDLGLDNESAIKDVEDSYKDEDGDFDDKLSLLDIKDLRSINREVRKDYLKRVGVEDTYVGEEDGQTVLKIIRSFGNNEDNKEYIKKYIHSSYSSSEENLYSELVKSLDSNERQEFYEILSLFYPKDADIEKFNKVESLIDKKVSSDPVLQLINLYSAPALQLIDLYEKSQSDDIIATFTEQDFKHIEEVDKIKGHKKGTFRLRLINDLLIGFTGDDDENSLINLFKYWPDESSVATESRNNIQKTLLKKVGNEDMAILKRIHSATHGPEYQELREVLSGFFEGNDDFKSKIINAIDGKYEGDLEVLAFYTPISILASLSTEEKTALVNKIAEGNWTDGWDEETLLRLFRTVNQESKEDFITGIKKERSLDDLKDDFDGDNYTSAVQSLNTLDSENQAKRIQNAIDATENYGIIAYDAIYWRKFDSIIGELTAEDLRDEEITLEHRKKFIMGILGSNSARRSLSVVGDFDEKTLIRIIVNTPPHEITKLILWLRAEEGEVFSLLENAIDGAEYDQLHLALTEVSEVDFYMGYLTGIGVEGEVFGEEGEEKEFLKPLNKSDKRDKEISRKDFKTLRERQNRVRAIRDLKLAHDKVVPFADAGIFNRVFTAKKNVEYDVSWTKDDKIKIKYHIGFNPLEGIGALGGYVRIWMDDDVSVEELSGEKVFEPSEMIGVYFLHDDDEVNAKAGEIKIMSAFNLFHLENKQFKRQVWDTVDLVFLLLGIAEFRAAASIIGRIIAIIDITLASATILSNNFRNELPKEVQDVVDIANVIFGGYMLIKGGIRGIRNAKKTLENLKRTINNLSGELRKFVDGLYESFNAQLTLAMEIDRMSPEELMSLRNEITSNVELPTDRSSKIVNLIDDKLKKLGQEIPGGSGKDDFLFSLNASDDLLQESISSPIYKIDGVEVDAQQMIKNLQDENFLRKVIDEKIDISIVTNDPTDEVYQILKDSGLLEEVKQLDTPKPKDVEPKVENKPKQKDPPDKITEPEIGNLPGPGRLIANFEDFKTFIKEEYPILYNEVIKLSDDTQLRFFEDFNNRHRDLIEFNKNPGLIKAWEVLKDTIFSANISVLDQVDLWFRLGATSQMSKSGIVFTASNGVDFARFEKNKLYFLYAGFGGDILVKQDRVTTVLGKFNDIDSLGTWTFLTQKGGLPDGIISRVVVNKPPNNSIAFLDLPEKDYNSLINKHIRYTISKNPKFEGNESSLGLIKSQSEKELEELIQDKILPNASGDEIKDILEIGKQNGNKEFWDKYNYQFLEKAFERGDDIRVVSDPSQDSPSRFGTFANELDAIENPKNGLMHKYDYKYNPETKTYEKQ